MPSASFPIAAIAAASTSEAPRAREPIPFDRTPSVSSAPRFGSEIGIRVIPLVIGFAIFMTGLLFYLWAR